MKYIISNQIVILTLASIQPAFSQVIYKCLEMQSATTSLAIARNCHLHTHTFSHVLASVCHLLQRMTFTFLQPSSSLLTSRTPKTLIDGKWCCQPSPNIMNMSHNQPMREIGCPPFFSYSRPYSWTLSLPLGCPLSLCLSIYVYQFFRLKICPSICLFVFI